MNPIANPNPAILTVLALLSPQYGEHDAPSKVKTIAVNK